MTVVPFDPTSSPKVDTTLNSIGHLVVATILVGATVALGCGGERSTTPPTVDIIAEDYEFQVPDTVPAGWVTFRMHNQGSETHYMEIDRLPDEVTVTEFRFRQERIGTVYDSLGSLLDEGALDTAEAVSALRSVAPDGFWGGDLTDLGRDAGGIGLVGPGETARTTLRLEPGTYSMICLMPTAEGKRHVSLGMIAVLVVAGRPTEAEPPAPDVVMRQDGGDVSTEGSFRTGRQIIAFHVDSVAGNEDGGKVGAYLTRLDDGTRSEDLVRWVTEGEYQPPAPTTFLGGVDEIGVGDSAYVTLDLEVGRYGWVIYPFGSDTEPFVEEFTVE